MPTPNNLFAFALDIACQPNVTTGATVLGILRRMGYPLGDAMLAARECVRAGIVR